MESYGATETRADNSQFSDALKTNGKVVSQL